MFDISFSEILLILVVALVILGPEKLPRVMRTLGFLWGRSISYWHRLRFDWEQEMHRHDVTRWNEKDHQQDKKIPPAPPSSHDHGQ